jgi:hypothetical protein
MRTNPTPARTNRLANTLPSGNIVRARALYALMDDGEGEPERHQAALRALIGELGGSTPDEVWLRARIKVTLAMTLSSSAPTPFGRLDLAESAVLEAHILVRTKLEDRTVQVNDRTIGGP